jgi:outer membrane lipoprotein SlyB
MEKIVINHPMMIAAVVTVISISVLGISAIMGWLPPSRSPVEMAVITSNIEQAGAVHSTAGNCGECGVVESIRVETILGKPSGMGAMTGVLVGGLLGHQVVDGNGKDLAAIGGAVGGAYLGNEMEKSMKQQTRYRVIVLMHDNTQRTFYYTEHNLDIGQRVKVINNRVVPDVSS